MDPDTAMNELGGLCVEHIGAQLAAFARPATALVPAADGTRPGRSRLGGPALLDPGTAWPEYEGYPLSLLAVIDAEQVAPWAGARFPALSGLLNFFCLQINDLEYQEKEPYRSALPGLGNPLTCRIVPADPARAREAQPPPLAGAFSPVPLDTASGIMLPDFTDDPALYALALGAHASEGLYGAMPGLFVEERFGAAWDEYVARRQPLLDGNRHHAFGWPNLGGGSCLQTSLRPKEEFTRVF